jgi:nucleotide-binding universal stress UspA family protein
MIGNKTSGRFQRILVGYDGSQESEKAFQVGLSIANTPDSRLEILAVIQPGEPAASVSPHDVLERSRKYYELALRKIVEAANGRGGDVETDIVVGHPADEIIKRAEQSLRISLSSATAERRNSRIWTWAQYRSMFWLTLPVRFS